jgi:hypothetical protein
VQVEGEAVEVKPEAPYSHHKDLIGSGTVPGLHTNQRLENPRRSFYSVRTESCQLLSQPDGQQVRELLVTGRIYLRTRIKRQMLASSIRRR